MILVDEFLKQLIKDFHFPAVVDNVLAKRRLGIILNLRKNIRVGTYFPELHMFAVKLFYCIPVNAFILEIIFVNFELQFAHGNI